MTLSLIVYIHDSTGSVFFRFFLRCKNSQKSSFLCFKTHLVKLKGQKLQFHICTFTFKLKIQTRCCLQPFFSCFRSPLSVRVGPALSSRQTVRFRAVNPAIPQGPTLTCWRLWGSTSNWRHWTRPPTRLLLLGPLTTDSK